MALKIRSLYSLIRFSRGKNTSLLIDPNTKYQRCCLPHHCVKINTLVEQEMFAQLWCVDKYRNCCAPSKCLWETYKFDQDCLADPEEIVSQQKRFNKLKEQLKKYEHTKPSRYC